MTTLNSIITHDGDNDFTLTATEQGYSSVWITVGNISVYLYHRLEDGEVFVTLTPKGYENHDGANLAECMHANQQDALDYIDTQSHQSKIIRYNFQGKLK